MAYDKFAAVDSSTLLFPPTVRANLTGRGNAVINGGFDVWQRGTSFAPPPAVYTANTADRWNSFRGGFATGFTVSRQSASLTGFQYCARVQRDSGNTSTAQITFNQTLESVNSIPFAGQAVTLSFYARAGANYSASGGAFTMGVSSGTGTDQNVQSGFTGNTVVLTASATLTTSWQRFSATGTVSSSATQLGLASSFTPVGTAGAADYFEITGVQLEAGAVATPFRRNADSIQAELAACQRYFQNYTVESIFGAFPVVNAGATNSTTILATFVASVPFRVKPHTLVVSTNTRAVNLQDNATYVITSASLSTAWESKIAPNVSFITSGLTANSLYRIGANGDVNAFMSLNAEL